MTYMRKCLTPKGKEFIIDFIHLYRRHPALWKANCIEYNSRRLKYHAYDELAKFYKKAYPEATANEAKNKLFSMRSTHRMELRKIENARAKGETYVPVLWYFKHFSFITRNKVSNKANRFPKKENQIENHNLESTDEENNCENADDGNPAYEYEVIDNDPLTSDRETEQRSLRTRSRGLHDSDKRLVTVKIEKEMNDPDEKVYHVKLEDPISERKPYVSKHFLSKHYGSVKSKVKHEKKAKIKPAPNTSKPSAPLDPDERFGQYIGKLLRRVADKKQRALAEDLILETLNKAALDMLKDDEK